MSRLHRALWGVLVLALVHAALTVACRTPSADEPLVLMPAAGGSITELGIQFHEPGHERFLPVFARILAELQPGTRVRVVVADEADRRRFLDAVSPPAGVALSFAETGHPITSWMRDRLAVRTTLEGEPRLLAPPAPMTGPEARVRDWLVPWTLADELGVDVAGSRYVFEGGDLIADADRAYVADAFVVRNPEWTEAELLAELAGDLGLPVLRLGSEAHPVPDHHIGMFLTPLGDGRVAVGDPDLALAAVGLGDLVVGGEALALDRAPERLDRFRRVAEELEAAGLEAVRIPILPTLEPYVFLSANNAMLEHRADGLHVWMPWYGVAAFDRASTEAWEAAGAVVHPIDVREVFRLGGSVRCLVAPLRRGTPAARTS